MKKNIEKVFLRIGAIWNIITGTITLFYYSSWMQKNVLTESVLPTNELLADRYYFQSVYLFVIGYGLIFILIGAINYFISTKINKETLSNGILIWLFVWSLLSYITADIIGFILYFATVLTLIIKFKLLKLNTVVKGDRENEENRVS